MANAENNRAYLKDLCDESTYSAIGKYIVRGVYLVDGQRERFIISPENAPKTHQCVSVTAVSSNVNFMMLTAHSIGFPVRLEIQVGFVIKSTLQIGASQ